MSVMPLFLIIIFMARLPQGITNLGRTASIVASKWVLQVFISVGDMSASRTVGHFTEAATANGTLMHSFRRLYSILEKGSTSPNLYFKESERSNISQGSMPS